MTHDSPRPWFAPKRYGYGAGLPIAPQGWALLAGYLLVSGLFVALLGSGEPMLAALGVAVLFVATIGLLLIAARRTRGGWRWRWGQED